MPKDKPSKLPYRRDRSPALAALIKYIEAELTEAKGRGGIAWLAKTVGLRKQGVSKWHNIPIERVPSIARATGLPMYQIRPDLPEIFPPSAARHRKAKATAD